MLSCDPVVFDIDSEKYVSIYSTFYNTSEPTINIYYTAGVFNDSCTAVKNATINLWEDGNLITDFENIIYGIYSKDGFNPLPGANYKMKIEIPDWETIEAEFEMPEMVTFKTLYKKIDSVVVTHTPEYDDTIYHGNDSSMYIYTVEARNDTVAYLYLEIEIDDPQGANDFYDMFAIPSYFNFIDFTPLYDGNYIIEEGENNIIRPQFDDELLNQADNILKFNATYNQKYHLIIYLFHKFTGNIKNKYHPSLSNSEESEKIIDIFTPDIETEPIISEDNVNNGIGYIYGISCFSDTIDITLPPESEWIYVIY